MDNDPIRNEDGGAPQESLPDPNGPPQPVQQDAMINLLTTGGVVAAVAGSLFAMTSVIEGPTRGATRSAKLEWESRSAQIEQVFQEERAAGEVPRAVQADDETVR